MRWYSDYPGQRSKQIVADVVASGLILIWVLLGILVGQIIAGLGAIGQAVADAGTGIKTSMGDIGTSLAEIPLIGQGIATPFDTVSGAGDSLIEAGGVFQEIVTATSIGGGVLVAAGPILITACCWLIPRWLRIRRATRLRAALDADGRVDLDAFLELEYRAAGVRRVAGAGSLSATAAPAAELEGAVR